MTNILNASVDGIVLTASNTAALNIQVGGTSALLLGASGQFGIGGANYGTAGQVLTSNGSGAAPSWQDGGGSKLQSQEFLASGTFTVPTGITSVWVTMIGGGGSGAAGTSGRGGGGAGAYCFKRPFSVTAGASLTVTIGGGGAGVLALATGNPGTSTSFSSLTVTGGSGGGVSTSTQNPVLAGAGGSAGATGTEGGVAEGSLLGGRGGQSLYNGTAYIGGGGGGFGDGTAASTTTLGNSANAATNSGAGSGAQAAAAAASSSGNGGSGRVIIEWFA